MLYKKPNDLKYTEMSIYIDELVERGNPTNDELTKAYQYIYHIIFMLAHKHKYFNENHYYEEFAIYFASDVMNRLFFNPKIGKKKEDGTYVMTPIKSVLNFIKAVIYGRKVAFEQEFYSQRLSQVSDTSLLSSDLDFSNKLRNSCAEYSMSDLKIYISQLSRTTKHIIYSHNPYRNNKVMMKNIYLSCMLSLLNFLCFTERDMDDIENKYSTVDSKYNHVCRQYKSNKINSIILYHLDEDMRDYITVLVNKVLRSIADDINEIIHSSSIVTDDIMSSIIFLELDGGVHSDN